MLGQGVAGRLVTGLASVALLAGCAGGASGTATTTAGPGERPTIVPSRPVPTAVPSRPVPTAVPSAGVTPGPPSAGETGHVIRVKLLVPIKTALPEGAPCDAATLRATGPVAATIPGASLQFLRIVDQTAGTFASIGARPVPASGVAVQPITDDAAYPAACEFAFEVPTTADADRYFFQLDRVYFPIPIVLRDQLEASGWEVSIGVNPQ